MLKEIEDFYSCLGRLEEAYQTEISNPQYNLAIDEARLKLELAVSKIEMRLNQLTAQKEVPVAQAE